MAKVTEMIFETRCSFFSIKALKILKIYILKDFFLRSWKHVKCQTIISTLCVENQTLLYTQLEWTNCFSVLCHLWKGAYGNVIRLYKNCVAQPWMHLVLAKSRGNKFFKQTTPEKCRHTLYKVAV